MFTKLGRDEILRAPHLCLGVRQTSPRGGSRAGKNKSIRDPFSKGLLLQNGRLPQQTEYLAVSKSTKVVMLFWSFILRWNVWNHTKCTFYSSARRARNVSAVASHVWWICYIWLDLDIFVLFVCPHLGMEFKALSLCPVCVCVYDKTLTMAMLLKR